MPTGMLEGSLNGQDMPVTDSGGVEPTPEQVREAFGLVGAPISPPPLPVPTSTPPPATTPLVEPPLVLPTQPPVSPASTAQPLATAPAELPLPAGTFGTFKDVNAMYKSWREAASKIDRQRTTEQQLREENNRLRALATFTPAPAQLQPPSQPPQTQEQILNRFVADPLGFQNQLKQQVAQEYILPVVQALQSLYAEMNERNNVAEADRGLYDSFKSDRVFDVLRQDPSLQGLTNRQLLEIGKARMVQHQFEQLQTQVSQTDAERLRRNARTTVETGGSQAIPAKTLEQMTEQELEAIARQQWQAGERF